jgi:hypothetical protein
VELIGRWSQYTDGTYIEVELIDRWISRFIMTLANGWRLD